MERAVVTCHSKEGWSREEFEHRVQDHLLEFEKSGKISLFLLRKEACICFPHATPHTPWEDREVAFHDLRLDFPWDKPISPSWMGCHFFTWYSVALWKALESWLGICKGYSFLPDLACLRGAGLEAKDQADLHGPWISPFYLLLLTPAPWEAGGRGYDTEEGDY